MSKYQINDKVNVMDEKNETRKAQINKVNLVGSGDDEQYTYDIQYDNEDGVISDVKEDRISNINDDSGVSNSKDIDINIIKSIKETVNENGTKTTCIITETPLRGGLKSRKPKKKVAKKRTSQKKRKGSKRKNAKSA